MRSPRASAVVVALSTFVAVAVVAAVVSQLTPLDRAGASLPDGPITVTGPPTEQTAASGGNGDVAPGTDSDDADEADEADDDVANGEAIVVAPAPAETVGAEPTPDPAPPVPAAPGNSGSAPGQTSAPGNSANAPGQNKP